MSYSAPASRFKIRNAYVEACIAARRLEEVVSTDNAMLPETRLATVQAAVQMRLSAEMVKRLMADKDQRELNGLGATASVVA